MLNQVMLNRVARTLLSAKQSPPVLADIRIDEVVVTYFAKPHSYTTDDIVEISAHGSPVVLHHIVELALTSGARLPSPANSLCAPFLMDASTSPRLKPS